MAGDQSSPLKSNSMSDLHSDDSTVARSNITMRSKRKQPEDSLSPDFELLKRELTSMFREWAGDQTQKFEKLNNSLLEVKAQNTNIEVLNKETVGKLDLLSKQHEQALGKIDSLETKQTETSSRVCDLENKFDDVQRQLRSSSVLVRNIPPSETSLLEISVKLFETVGTELRACDIRNCYRQGKKDTAKPIVIELSNPIQKANLLKASKAYNLSHKEDKLNTSLLGFNEKNTHFPNIIVTGDVNIDIKPDSTDPHYDEYLNTLAYHGLTPAHTIATREDAFKQAVISPIHKDGNRDDVNNYRPISILPALSKLLERLMNTRLVKYLESNNILSPNQYGFRKGRSTEDAVNSITSMIARHLDNKKKCTAVFLDLAKAFDTVSVPILLAKMECLETGSHLFQVQYFKIHNTTY
ncbi:uncharacterized protein LOC125238682 [Leguminivora glycinivorella]|uniref:uncharacterized protein LOC125238682 n=1 Tax=Leguminivora glycinivorella TaxID=1035111 RepID=UPI00200C4B12|nr:uncharacterized protein LOC125238682 [Leguminivora glycinivorella]